MLGYFSEINFIRELKITLYIGFGIQLWELCRR